MLYKASPPATWPIKRSIILLLISGLAVMPSQGRDDANSRPVGQAVSRLWLPYAPVTLELQKDYSAVTGSIYCPGNSPILTNARDELLAAIEKLTGTKVELSDSAETRGGLLLGTIAELHAHLPEALADNAESLKDDGYVIESMRLGGKEATVITSKTHRGVLYGAFHFIRLMQTGKSIACLRIAEEPAVDLRMLNHWDNLSGSIERGYAGKSLWKWDELPDTIDPRYRQYARFCASIGINGVALNNVNADPRILRDDYLEKVSALAGVFREWGIKTYVCPNYASPMSPSETPDRFLQWGGVGNLDTADPMAPRVQEWWENKVTEIYKRIPDFGGFLVKADSEGMPGPKTYHRSHLDGANMLAGALRPHGGVLIWRAFVYGHSKDRAMDAYHEFEKYDGQFSDNVLLQIKNGPIDFQPREPFTPLFGAMPNSNLAMEFQIAKEYLGHSTTLAYLAPMWSEVLHADTYAKGKGSTVAKVVDGTLDQRQRTCIAGVANTGDNADWCGSMFNHANWFAFGRLAWDHQLTPEAIAEEWIAMTFQTDAATRASIKRMMMGSHEACVDYTMPMGLILLCDFNHYRPQPSKRFRYHNADANGLGFNRTKDGSNYVGQYHPEWHEVYNDMEKTPLDYLLWFHHVPWDQKLSSGRTLWEELKFRYNRGVAAVDGMAETWMALEGKIDAETHASVMAKLKEEKEYARLWRNTCLTFFAEFADK